MKIIFIEKETYQETIKPCLESLSKLGYVFSIGETGQLIDGRKTVGFWAEKKALFVITKSKKK